MSERKRVVLVTGTRAPAALEIAWRLHREGYEVVTADSTPARLCRGVGFVAESFEVCSPLEDGERFLGGIAEICDKWEVALVVPTCEEVFHLARRRDGLPGLFAPGFATLRELHDKLLFARLVERLGDGTVGVPRSFAGEDFAGEAGSWVAKPRYSRFGARVRFLDSGEAMSEFLTSVRAEEWMAQERVMGEVLCSYAWAFEGAVLGGVLYRQLATVSGGAAIAFEVVEDVEISEWVGRLVAERGLSGQVAFDFLVDTAGQRWVIECNPRATSGVHFLLDEGGLGRAMIHGEGRVKFAGVGSKMALKVLTFFKEPRVALECEDVFKRFYSGALIWNQVGSLWHFFREGRRRGCSMSEASVRDVEWNGGGDE